MSRNIFLKKIFNAPAPKCVFGGEIATVHCCPSIALAFPSVFPYIELAELRGACWISIPGALSISKGAVPGLARGLGYTAPTYAVGFRDRYPTAIAAPRLPIFTPVASCSSPSRPCARGLLHGGARRASRPPPLTPRISRPKASPSSCACAPGIVAAYFPLAGEPSTLPLLQKLAAAGVKTALPVTGRRDTPLVFRLWRPGEPTLQGKMAIEEPLPAAPEAAPDFLFVPLAAFDRAGHRIGYGAGFYDRSQRGYAPKSQFARLASPMRARRILKFRTMRTTKASITCSRSAS